MWVLVFVVNFFVVVFVFVFFVFDEYLWEGEMLLIIVVVV